MERIKWRVVLLAGIGFDGNFLRPIGTQPNFQYRIANLNFVDLNEFSKPSTC